MKWDLYLVSCWLVLLGFCLLTWAALITFGIYLAHQV